MIDAQNTPKRPVEKHRDGALEVAIWKQDSDKRSFYTTERTRAYQDKNGDWKKSHSIPERDLLRAARLDEKAYESIQKIRDQDRAQYVGRQKQSNTQTRDQDQTR